MKNLLTVADFAKKRCVPVQTVYSWIYRDKSKENKFRVVQIGSVKLIKDNG